MSSATISADSSAPCAWTLCVEGRCSRVTVCRPGVRAGQFVRRREEALLQVCVLVLPRARLAGCAMAAVGLFCRPGCGVHDQRVPQRRRPRRSAGQEFSEVGGVGDPGAGIRRVMRAESPRPFPGGRMLQSLGAEAEQDRLDDGGVIEDGARHRARFHPGRHHDRRYPHAVAAERRGVVVWRLRRRDVIIEAPVLVIDDDQE